MSQRNIKNSPRLREERQAEPIERDTKKNKLELAKLIGDDIKLFEEQGIDLDDLENIAHGKMKEEEYVATAGLPPHVRDIIDNLFINIAVHMTDITNDTNILEANQSRVGKKILAIATVLAQYKIEHGRLPDWTTYLNLTGAIINRNRRGGKKSKKYRKKSKKNRKKTKKHHKRKSRRKRR